MEAESIPNPHEMADNARELRYFQKVIILEKELRLLRTRQGPYLKEIGMLQSELEEQKQINRDLNKLHKALSGEHLVIRLENQKLKDKVESLQEKLSVANAIRQSIIADMTQTPEWQGMIKRLKHATERIESQKESINSLLGQLKKLELLEGQ